jgi:two-component system response regulator NreC
MIAVILGDDHAVLRAGLRLLVDGQADMKVVGEAADGAEAVRKTRQLRPDVVVLDLSMPRTDPLATIRQLCALGTRVVVLTMHDDPAYVDSSLAAGADGYVVKKAADVELLAAIRAVSRGRRFLDIKRRRVDRGAHGQSAFRPLSTREENVLRLVGYGFTNREIATQLRVSVKTVETFRARVCVKLRLRTRSQLVRYALDMGLVASEEDAAVTTPSRRTPEKSPA